MYMKHPEKLLIALWVLVGILLIPRILDNNDNMGISLDVGDTPLFNINIIIGGLLFGFAPIGMSVLIQKLTNQKG